MLTAQEHKIGDYREIINQLGANKFLTMTGSKILYYGYNDNGYVYIVIKLAKNKLKATHLKIQYNSMDLYDMEFVRIKKVLNNEYAAIGIKIYDDITETIKTYNDVYGDSLQDIFISVTGLYTRLF